MTFKAVLILGGNQGNREGLLHRAIGELEAESEVLLKSRVYESESWGQVAQGNFLNQVVLVETNLSPNEFLVFIQGIENKLGRKRNEKWGNRTMDIDILFWENEEIHTSDLTVPHPFIQDRRFVLAPLAEILPDWIHPVFQKPVSQLLEECQDPSKVWVFEK
ncbi:2-amino-4-hydroxy-6-hydroxymethyldihydropteridine diphosphokinase [Algoriphagus sp. CAU 1675]|uniref:2-amino-4-hydroxy-6- hydroxymethyldihydropteridine diphosphokinase n=1 Tax=Algoriphagus sp. CAU 1675 TaxID=3032597 RepID=UPI0023DC5CB4|nr:2-amino-4-hydroxy-6-hydroxymethyldihydropteridine diphosphokinase [Algoriphagus sp. CAU 1675]MDF2157553.1 2-amino-4-hydroxy-6-hydroxymethyldihydropteridine diphosphokinase [Algoriphagus sp. CAU 1675]